MRNRYQYKKARKRAAERDNSLCVLCGRPAIDTHHVVFRSHGGRDIADNLVCLCRDCHNMAHGVREKQIQQELLEYLKKVS
jgi:5-methylcytosine-specific restriction endonuclease McrA